MSSPQPDEMRPMDVPPKGFFAPPGGYNPHPHPHPHPDEEFAEWAYLPPTSGAAGTVPVSRIYTPKIIIRSRVDQPEAWIVNHYSSSLQSKLQLSSNANRDIVELGPENPWKPCKNWEDSRQKYPMGRLFPMPGGGWTNSEKRDYKQAVKDLWKPLSSNESDRQWIADELWRFREREKIKYWNDWKKPSNPGSGTDTGSGEQGLNSTPEIHTQLMLNMQLGDWPEWEYHEVERGDSTDDPDTSSASSAMNTPSTTGYSTVSDISPLPPPLISRATIAGVKTSHAQALVTMPPRGSAERGLSGRGGRGRGGASRREQR